MKTLSMQVTTEESKPVDELVKIKSVEDITVAIINFDVGQLMLMTDEKRVEICEELVKQCKAIDAEPAPLWQQVIDEPELFNRLAQDHAEGLI